MPENNSHNFDDHESHSENSDYMMDTQVEDDYDEDGRIQREYSYYPDEDEDEHMLSSVGSFEAEDDDNDYRNGDDSEVLYGYHRHQSGSDDDGNGNDEDEEPDHSSDNNEFGGNPFHLPDILETFAQRLEQRRQTGRGQVQHPAGRTLPEILSMIGGRMERSVESSSRNERISKLIENAGNASDDPYIAMESLKELSENILMMNQMVVDRVIPMETLIEKITTILSDKILKEELELQMQACRCMYNLFEVCPESISIAVDGHVIPILQEKLVEISYIDLAEQVLETVEYISRVHGRDILKTGQLSIYVQFFDFLTIHAQRKAVAIVSNACSSVRMDDFSTVVEVLPTLKPIFTNTIDQPILIRLVNALYGICGALHKDEKFESLFSLDFTERIVNLISIQDTPLENKLKCLEILTILAMSSKVLSRELREKTDIIDMITRSFQHYSKNSKTGLHETLMFVPNTLLISISRFIVVLFPPEDERILSRNRDTESGESDIIANPEKFAALVQYLIPILVEIYTNAADFDVRRYVLIALLRVVSCMNNFTANTINDQVIKLIGSILAQEGTAFIANGSHSTEVGTLLIGGLSLLDLICRKFSDLFLPSIKREGIFDLVKDLSVSFNSIDLNEKENGDISLSDEEEDLHSSIEESADADDDYDYDFSDMEIPDSVKPKRISIHIFRTLSLAYVKNKGVDLVNKVLSQMNVEQEAITEELHQIESVVSILEDPSTPDKTQEDWKTIWSVFQKCIFHEDFDVSGFEFTSTGLASSIIKRIMSSTVSHFVLVKAFLEVFEDNVDRFLNILQSALTRQENFSIVDCGLHDGDGVSSLAKEIRIKLVYDGDATEDNIGADLSSTVVSVHCIASFMSLNEFLRHRMVRMRFLNSLIPNLTSSSADAIGEEEENCLDDMRKKNFEFFYDDEKVDMESTVFGVIFNKFVNQNGDLKTLWNDTQTIKFRKSLADGDSEQEAIDEAKEVKRLRDFYKKREFVEVDTRSAADILELLDFLHSSGVKSDCFINSKLSAKLARQLDEPLVVASGALPDWSLFLTRKFPFLFPFDTRMFFLQCTSFGYGRLIQIWKNKTKSSKDSRNDEALQQLGRITRRKLRISRKTIFATGLKILSKYGGSPDVLEIEYQEEAGTGLGPTLEFYSVVSKYFARKSLRMWRCNSYSFRSEMDMDTTDDYITSLLFPEPLNISADNEKILELYGYLGTFVARSLLDNRILDFRFSKVFFELLHRMCTPDVTMLPNDVESCLLMIELVDPLLAKSLKYVFANKNNNSALEELFLTFTVPGNDNIELVPGGSSKSLNSSNVGEYIRAVIDQILGKGIEKQLIAFAEGFSKVFSYERMLTLFPEELVEIFGRVEEDWSIGTLYTNLNAEHGYTMDSSIIHDLISIISTFSKHERRLFLQFLTGSPKLPIGGFKSLNPKFTVVLKHAEDGLAADEYLPSVMTCANYLKLPKYTSKGIMRSRLCQAIEEGAGAFLLS
ncbi:ufd4p [Saccharomyces arboricola H-6]|uniref:HECT-type E3 ubiquitin transferase n=1 Tax=Saccharomyces arboricola (strain H-6 / AS 2.3317 / CBS 10644) TaxID=1160507 RepID=J8PLA4_SACAR|nr:ufd4p [Saccharomyces arboricola H-6]